MKMVRLMGHSLGISKVEKSIRFRRSMLLIVPAPGQIKLGEKTILMRRKGCVLLLEAILSTMRGLPADLLESHVQAAMEELY